MKTEQEIRDTYERLQARIKELQEKSDRVEYYDFPIHEREEWMKSIQAVGVLQWVLFGTPLI